MNINTTLLMLIISASFNLFAQRGKDGDHVVNTQNEWLNAFTALTANANAGSNTVQVVSNNLNQGFFLSNLAAGDLVLIYQAQGATVDINTTSIGWGGEYTAQNSWFTNENPDWDQTEYGQVLNYQSAGFYEYLEVAAVQGNQTIVFNCPLTHSYTAAHKVQIVRIPRFNNLTISNNASISAPLWNGQTGGIVALEVEQELNLIGTAEINAVGIGFRGGAPNNFSSLASGPGGSQGYLGSFAELQGAEKGESLFGYHDELDAVYSRFCRGAVANGGGGANFHNAGGGGGSNVGTGNFTGKGVPSAGANNAFVPAWNLEDPTMLSNPSAGGGRGGYSHGANNNNPLTVGPNQNAWSGDFRRVTGGIGGHPLNYDSNRVFFGGGGGAGDGNDNYAGAGGRGGGLIFIKSYGTIIGNGAIRADGQKGGNATGPTPPTFSSSRTGDDGAGGGGGGGSVHISNRTPLPNSVRLFAQGGAGGDQNVQVGQFGNMSCEGPGGGGAGGLISYSSGNPQENVQGGISGVTNSTFVNNFNVNGATGGAAGLSAMTNGFFDLIVEDQTLCGEGSAEIVVNVEGTLPPNTPISWFTSPFGGTSFHTGTSYTTPNINSTTTYYVGVCPSSFRKAVNVFFSPEITITGTPNITDETCAGNDGTITGITVNGGTGDLSFDWNGVAAINASATNLIGGEYTLTVTDENNCTATAGPFTVGASPGPAINTSGIIIAPETCNGNDGAISGITATGDGLSYSWNGNASPNADLVDIIGGTYTLTVTDENECTQTAGPFNVPSEDGPSINTDNIVITNETCFGNDGTITGISATGNGLTFEWNGEPASIIDLTNAASGEYTLTIFDSENCQSQVGPFEIGLNDGPGFDTTNLIVTPEICENGNGAISGIIITDPYVSAVWNEGLSTDLNLSGLSEGSYTLVITDDIGCESTIGPLNVNNLASPNLDLTNIVIQEESCFENDGAISGIIAVGNGLSFSWNQVSGNLDLSGVSAGSYVLVATDTNGCEAVAGPFEIIYNPGPTINSENLLTSNESCLGNDGSINGISANGSGLSYSWNGVSASGPNADNLPAGNYTLIVEDQNGCSVTLGPITIEQDPLPTITVTPNSVEINKGQSVTLVATVFPELEGEITWTPETDLSCTACFSTVASPSETTNYSAIFVTEEGCEVSADVLITVNETCEMPFVPTIFSPNGDGTNDFLCVEGICIAEMQLIIFNRWGELVFETKTQTDCWDGTLKGEQLNAGVFAFQLSGKLINGQVIEQSGMITLVK